MAVLEALANRDILNVDNLAFGDGNFRCCEDVLLPEFPGHLTGNEEGGIIEGTLKICESLGIRSQLFEEFT